MYAGIGLEIISSIEAENYIEYRGFHTNYLLEKEINHDGLESMSAKKIIIQAGDEYLTTTIPIFFALKDIKKFVSLDEHMQEKITTNMHDKQQLEKEYLYTDNQLAQEIRAYQR
jgi:hypothetical protein